MWAKNYSRGQVEPVWALKCLCGQVETVWTMKFSCGRLELPRAKKCLCGQVELGAKKFPGEQAKHVRAQKPEIVEIEMIETRRQ